MVIFYKKLKKYNEIQLTKNKMDLNIRKITNNPPSLEMRSQPLICTNSNITAKYKYSIIIPDDFT